MHLVDLDLAPLARTTTLARSRRWNRCRQHPDLVGQRADARHLLRPTAGPATDLPLLLPVGLQRDFGAEELGGSPGETAVPRCKELRAEDWFLVTR
jgi:hypothetical protein